MFIRYNVLVSILAANDHLDYFSFLPQVNPTVPFCARSSGDRPLKNPGAENTDTTRMWAYSILQKR
jgi:hypothetical protein